MQASLEKNDWPRFSGLTLGKIYGVHPEANMVDIMLFDGSLLTKVQVMGNHSSSRSGVVNLPLPVYEKKSMIDRQDPLAMAKQNESDVFAIVGFIGGSILRPIVLGFLFPEENELLCNRDDQKGNKDGTMFLWKHESNVYLRVSKGDTVDQTPDIEISHPSGLLLKIGEGTERTEINNYDKTIRPFRYKNPDNDEFSNPPTVHLYHPSGNYLTIGTDGKVSVYAISDMDKTVKGNLTETIDGNVVRTIKGNLTETIEGNTTETTEGNETNTVKGTWLRQSDTEIQDKCSAIHHNK